MVKLHQPRGVTSRLLLISKMDLQGCSGGYRAWYPEDHMHGPSCCDPLLLPKILNLCWFHTREGKMDER